MRFQPISDESARRMYETGRANRTARGLARAWSLAFTLGLAPRRWVTLEVPGRRTGEPRRFPLGMADVDGEWFLVSMLGECAWVANVRANEFRATLIRRGRKRPCRLDEVPVDARASILRRYVEKVPGGRPHIPVPVGAPAVDFREVAAHYPVFRVRYLDG